MKNSPDKKVTEIGGNFWLKPDQWDHCEKNLSEETFIKSSKDVFYTSSGRGAIRLFLQQIECSSKIVLLPFFTCDSVIEPFIDNEFEIIYYDLEEDFSINFNSLDSLIEKNNASILYLQSYFGFNTLNNSAEYVNKLKKNTGIHIIEDITHSLLGSYSYTNADYYVGSIRKWLEIPDGGVLISNKFTIDTREVERDECKEITELFINASKLKYDYLTNALSINKDEFRKLFYQSEAILNGQKEIFPLSQISKYVLSTSNYSSIKETRRKNYNFLFESLAKHSSIKIVFPKSNNDTIPLYFCVECKGNREEIQKKLTLNQIYAPIIWPKSAHISKRNNDNGPLFYENLLAIPCDQRYDLQNMRDIVTALEN